MATRFGKRVASCSSKAVFGMNRHFELARDTRKRERKRLRRRTRGAGSDGGRWTRSLDPFEATAKLEASMLVADLKHS